MRPHLQRFCTVRDDGHTHMEGLAWRDVVGDGSGKAVPLRVGDVNLLARPNRVAVEWP